MIFSVSVIGCNAELFEQNYNKFILEGSGDFDTNRLYTLNADEDVYNEIKDLQDDGIEVVDLDVKFSGEDKYICPHCGHEFEQGEYDYNYDDGLVYYECPCCDWQGNETEVELYEN